ncbi:hypothetical protein RUM44_001122 [Polyplax serrata]|uniref:Lipoprotein n=1 Tax=Polyplax serrata TaxID=468196 RepID=A0ABR1B6P3_POLSC
MRVKPGFLLLVPFLLSAAAACAKVLGEWTPLDLEERAKRSSIVFHGLAIEAIPANDSRFSYSVQFWLINVYKGAESVGKFLDLDPGSGGVFNLRDR